MANFQNVPWPALAPLCIAYSYGDYKSEIMTVNHYTKLPMPTNIGVSNIHANDVKIHWDMPPINRNIREMITYEVSFVEVTKYLSLMLSCLLNGQKPLQ